MKKLLLCVLLMILVVAVKADETANLEIRWIPNRYYSFVVDGVTHWGQFGYVYVDGKLAYCLDIYHNITTNYYEPTDEVQDNNLVLLAGYFGYGYNDEYLVSDYIATQKLIWQYLNMDVKVTSEKEGKGYEIYLFDNEVKIISRINRYALFPRYDSNFIFDVGRTYSILDLNNISDRFNILNYTNNNISSNNNILTFVANEEGNNKFYLQTKYDSFYQNVIYSAPNSQKIMVIGEVDNLSREYPYTINGVDLELNEDITIEDPTEEFLIDDNEGDSLDVEQEEPEVIEEENLVEEEKIIEEEENLEIEQEEPEVIEEENLVEEEKIIEEEENPEIEQEEPEVIEEENLVEEEKIIEEEENPEIEQEEPEVIEEENLVEEEKIIEEEENPEIEQEEPEVIEEENPVEEEEILEMEENIDVEPEKEKLDVVSEEKIEDIELDEGMIEEDTIEDIELDIEEVIEIIKETIIPKEENNNNSKLPYLGEYYEESFNDCMYFIKFKWMY